MKLLVKEIVGFGMLASLSIVGGYMSYRNAAAISIAFTEVIDYNYPATQDMLRVELDLYRLLATAREAGRNAEPTIMDSYRQSLADLDRSLGEFGKMSARQASDSSPQVRFELNVRQRRIESSIKLLESVMTPLVAKARHGHAWTEDDLIDVGNAGRRAFAVLEAAITREAEEASYNSTRASDVLRLAQHRLILIITLALLASVLLGFAFTLMVTRPLARLQAGVRRIGAGELDTRLDIATPDEVAEVARAVNEMAQSIRSFQGELQAARDYSESIVSTMGEALLILDAEGIIRSTNPAAGTLLELPTEALAGMALKNWTCERDRQHLAQLLRADGSYHEAEISLCSPSQPDIPVLLSLAPLQPLGDSACQFVCVVHDLRKTRLLERIEQANQELQAKNLRLQELDRLKDDFLAVASHELRTPLTAILGFCELLQNHIGGSLTADQEEYLGVIHQRGIDLQQIIKDILDVTQLRNNRLQVMPQVVDLQDLLDECLQMTGAQAAAKRLSMQLLPIAPQARRVWADSLRLRQVVLNLLSNAIKFTLPDGRIQIDARRNGSPYVVVSVADNGVGIAPEYHEAIFDRFRQVQPHATRTAEGLGLGLTITRLLVEQMSGQITVESHPGQGATFQFKIPVANGQGLQPDLRKHDSPFAEGTP